MTVMHLVIFCFNIFYVSLLPISVFAFKQHEDEFGTPAHLISQFQMNEQRYRSDECTTYKYDNRDGVVYGCGYSFDVFRVTTLHRARASLLSHLSKSRLSMIEQHLQPGTTYDIRSVKNISFAFESGTKRLFTAWGPDLQFRYLHSSSGYDMFENIDKNRPTYNHECAPFCSILQIAEKQIQNVYSRHSDQTNLNEYMESRQSSNNKATFYGSRNISVFLTNKISHETQLDIDGCENCNFGHYPQSCPDLMKTCLSNGFSCSPGPAYHRDDSSTFCMGLYHAFLNPNTASCPLEATTSDIYIYGVCDIIYLELKTKVDSGRIEITAQESPSSIFSSKLSTVNRVKGSSISVFVRSQRDDRKIMRRAIKKALKNGQLRYLDQKNIDVRRTLDSIDCKQLNGGTFKEQCKVDLYLKEVVER